MNTLTVSILFRKHFNLKLIITVLAQYISNEHLNKDSNCTRILFICSVYFSQSSEIFVLLETIVVVDDIDDYIDNLKDWQSVCYKSQA